MAGLDLTGLKWIGLDWTELDWIGLDWTRLDCLDWTPPHRITLDWIGLHCIKLVWSGLDWNRLGWTGLDWIALDWVGLDWLPGGSKMAPRQDCLLGNYHKAARRLQGGRRWLPDGICSQETQASKRTVGQYTFVECLHTTYYFLQTNNYV